MGAEEVILIMMIMIMVVIMMSMIMMGKGVEEVMMGMIVIMMRWVHRMHDLNPYLRCMHPVCKCGDSHFTR